MEAARELPPGTMLDDKYRIDRLLAVGGMGAVYAGTHVGLRKRVAIKVLNPAVRSPELIERFHREAITASQIGHEGIAQTTDLGTSLEGEPFLVMELLEGESLSARIRAAAPLPIEDVAELGCAILSPLAAAHAAGIVHRDLKPDNVFLVRLSRGEMVKLLDFGISRATQGGDELRLTTTGLVLGTPYYMSPEQARGETSVTLAADLYAFGVILYEMLIGHVPIHADNYNQLMYRVMMGDFVPPRQLRQDLPVELEALILQAMALDPAARPASADQLEQALTAFCRPTYREHMIERRSADRFSRPTLPPPPLLRSATGEVPKTPTGTDRTVLAAAPIHAPTLPSMSTPRAGSIEPARPAAPASRRGLALALGLVAAAGIAIAVVVASSGGGGRAPSTTAPTTAAPSSAPPSTEPTAPPTAPPATEPTAPPAAPTVTLRFAVEPSTAVITLDDRPVDGDHLSVPRDDGTHRLSITAPDHEPHAEEISFAESQRIVVKLRPRATAKPTRPTRPTPPTTPTTPDEPDKPAKPAKPERIDRESPYQP